MFAFFECSLLKEMLSSHFKSKTQCVSLLPISIDGLFSNDKFGIFIMSIALVNDNS